MTEQSPVEVVLRDVVSLTAESAVERVTGAGLEAVLVGPDATALTMDYRPQRIRLFLDASGLVLRATAG